MHGRAQEDGSLERLSPSDLAICFNWKMSLHSCRHLLDVRVRHPCEILAACKAVLSEGLPKL